MNEIPGLKVQLRGLNGDYNGIDYNVEGNEFLIGRHFNSNLVLKENTISGNHAKLIKKEDYYEIEDLGSTNGTSVNKNKITRQRLRTEDVISFDKFDFRFINPNEVGRTIISTDENFKSPDQTIVRAETYKGIEKKESEVAKHQEMINKYKSEKKRKENPGLFYGLILSLIIAFTVNIGFVFLITISKLPAFNSISIWNSFKGLLPGLPIMHTHIYWTILSKIDLSFILAGICIPVGLILSGLILQRTSGGNRFRNAFVLSFFYMIIVFFTQFAVLDFNFQSVLMINSVLRSGTINLLYSLLFIIGYVWVISFVFTIMGTLFLKDHK